MRNKRMEEMIKRGSAIDLKDCRKAFDFYIVEDKFALNCLAKDVAKDFCDSSTEQWIWSIGKAKHDVLAIKDDPSSLLVKEGAVIASTTGFFYQNPDFWCLWLR